MNQQLKSTSRKQNQSSKNNQFNNNRNNRTSNVKLNKLITKSLFKISKLLRNNNILTKSLHPNSKINFRTLLSVRNKPFNRKLYKQPQSRPNLQTKRKNSYIKSTDSKKSFEKCKQKKSSLLITKIPLILMLKSNLKGQILSTIKLESLFIKIKKIKLSILLKLILISHCNHKIKTLSPLEKLLETLLTKI